MSNALKLLPREQYPPAMHSDPIRLYYWPVLGRLYRRRVEMCLAECSGGERVLEVGYGSGVTISNLHDKYQEIYGLDLDADPEQVSETFRRNGIETQLSRGSVLEMPYPDGHFDTVLLISILEHLKPQQQDRAFSEIRRVLKPDGQVVYGVPVERRLMVFAFRLLGYNIREHHFSTHNDVSSAASRAMEKVRIDALMGMGGVAGPVYEVGHFIKR
jgi:ubiquinone/menaquinone biosynthesis C-methylase UbiE